MGALRFDVQWHDGAGIEGAELAATFASLRITASGSVLTQVDHQRAQTLRDVVFVPLYHIAEWLVSNWWFLAYEAQNRINGADPAFTQRHSMVNGAEGYAFPDVRVISAGRRTHIVWRSRTSEWSRLEFRNSGSATVERGEFLADCSEFVETVVRRLVAHGITATYLQSEWEVIQATDRDKLARQTRQAIGLNGKLIPTNADLADAIGHDPATLERVTRPISPLGSLTLIDGVVRPLGSGTVSLGLKASGETSRRFLFCRALAEALTAGSDALLTKASTERQQRNRAFAAEFLAPAASLRERILGRFADQDLVTDLAEEFGVSSYVIEHQVVNHGVAELVAA